MVHERRSECVFREGQKERNRHNTDWRLLSSLLLMLLQQTRC